MADSVTITDGAGIMEYHGWSTALEGRIYPFDAYMAEDGTLIPESSPYDGKGQFYWRADATITDGVVTLDDFVSVKPTLTAQDNPSARLGLFLYDTGTNRMVSPVAGLENFSLGDDASQTWEDIRLADASPSGSVTPGDRTINNLTVVQDASVGDDLSVGGDETVAGTVTALAFIGNGAGLTGIGTGTGGVLNTGSTTVGADTDSDGVGVIDFQTRVTTRARVNNDGTFELFKPARLMGYATGSLPSGLERQLAYDTDRKSPVWHNGNAWRLFTKAFDVADEGATGDGSTDDTAAINAAIAKLNTYGRGVLYFPAPTASYKVTGALTTITAAGRARGDGSGSAPSAVQWGSKIVMTSRTANLFTVTADSFTFEGLYLFNSNSTYGVGGAAPATPPTAGAGIEVVAGSSSTRVNLNDVVVEGFYDNVRQDGAHWNISRSYIINGVRYGLKVLNSIAADAGDWTVSDSHFISKTYLQPAMVRIDDAGGGKFANVKMNSYNDLGIPGTTGYTVGISAEYTATSILLLSNVSIENYDEKALDLTHVDLLMLSNVQIGDYYGTNTSSHPAILLTDCTDVVLASVMLRTINAPTQIGIQAESCTRVSQGTIVNDGFLGAFKFTTAYTNDFVPLTLATGWANTGAPFADAAFRYQHGLITLRGMVTYSSGGSTTIATLPAHVRPGQDKVFPAVASGAFQRIRINTDGTIVQEGAGPSGGVVQSLDGIFWDHQ